MSLQEAIAASDYYSAAAQIGVNEAICGANGHDGFYGFEIVDSMGNRLVERPTVTLEEIVREYPQLNWWPIRDNGEWGDEAEAAYGAN